MALLKAILTYVLYDGRTNLWPGKKERYWIGSMFSRPFIQSLSRCLIQKQSDLLRFLIYILFHLRLIVFVCRIMTSFTFKLINVFDEMLTVTSIFCFVRLTRLFLDIGPDDSVAHGNLFSWPLPITVSLCGSCVCVCAWCRFARV